MRFKVNDRVIYTNNDGRGSTELNGKTGAIIKLDIMLDDCFVRFDCRIAKRHLCDNGLKLCNYKNLALVHRLESQPIKKDELTTWHSEFPHLRSYIKDVMKTD